MSLLDNANGSVTLGEAPVPSAAEVIGAKLYSELVSDAVGLATELKIDYEVYRTTFTLLDKLKDHDLKTAKESLQTLPLALAAAESLGEFHGIEVDLKDVWSAALLHDIGKIAVPKELIDKSNAGDEWTTEDKAQMSYHATAGYQIAKTFGLSDEIAFPIGEHHAKQIGSPSYGAGLYLSYSQRITRDAIATADYFDADINRTNCRNRHLSVPERLAEVREDLFYVFNDYDRPNEVAEFVFARLCSVDRVLSAV